MKLSDITAAYVRETYQYDAKTGIFSRKFKNGKTRTVGSLNADGYVTISVRGISIYAHRLAWLWVYGVWPAQLIDHRNGKRYDNRLKNLRHGDSAYNNQNRIRSWGKTGLLGAHQLPSGRFRASITVRGKAHFLGNFKTAEEAHMAYVAAKQIHHPHAHIAQ